MKQSRLTNYEVLKTEPCLRKDYLCLSATSRVSHKRSASSHDVIIQHFYVSPTCLINLTLSFAHLPSSSILISVIYCYPPYFAFSTLFYTSSISRLVTNYVSRASFLSYIFLSFCSALHSPIGFYVLFYTCNTLDLCLSSPRICVSVVFIGSSGSLIHTMYQKCYVFYEKSLFAFLWYLLQSE